MKVFSIENNGMYASPIVPTASGTSINLVDSADAPIQGMTVRGKNLIDFKALLDYWGATYTETDGVFTITKIGSAYSNPYIICDLSDTTSIQGIIENVSSVSARIGFCTYDGVTKTNYLWINETTTNVSNKVGRNAIILDYATRGTFNVSDVQLEYGTEATPYEPYAKDIDVTVSNEDETLTQTATIDTTTQTGWEGLKTYYPITNIVPTPSATIDCTYVADTKNYIDNKLIALTALALEG